MMTKILSISLALASFVIIGWLILIFGIFEVVENMEENQCEMTYMFEYPQFLDISLDPEVKKKFPKYSLIIYGEGDHATRLQHVGVSGIPVLFIPGNAGSHKQVRSLASVALRKTEDLHFHFDFFAVDFNEELSALKGSYLVSQTVFVNECLKLILGMYRERNRAKDSVILIGHSMGGVVARGLFTLPHFNSLSVNTIITLAAPNQSPAFEADQDMHNYYVRLNAFWNQSNSSIIDGLKHLLILSIGGGSRDMQVRSDLTSITSPLLKNQSLSVVTTAVPKVYLSTDHRCIVWCKQLVLSIIRTLIDMVDKHDMEISKNEFSRFEALKYHFVSSFSSGTSFESAVSLTTMPPKFSMDLSLCKLFKNPSIFKSTARSQPCFLLDISHLKGELLVFYQGLFFNWIGVCKGIHDCKSFTTLSKMAHIIPSKSSFANVFRMNIKEIQNLGSAVLLSLHNPKEERLNFRVSDDLHVFKAPYFLAQAMMEILSQRTMIRVAFPFLSEPWLVYKLKVVASCKKTEPSLSICFHVPWMNEDVYKVFASSLEMKLKFTSTLASASQMTSQSKLFLPFFENGSNASHSETKHPEVQIWFNDKCNFSLETQLDPIGTSGHLLLFSSSSILNWLPALTLLWLPDEKSIFSDAHQDSTVLFAIAAPLFVAVICHSIGHLLITITKFCISCALLMALIYFSKLLMFLVLMIAKWNHFLAHKILTKFLPVWLVNKATKIVTFAVFILETICPIVMSLSVSGAVGIVTYFVCFLLCSTWRQFGDERCFTCCIIVVILKAFSLVSWFKDLEFGVRSDFNMSSLTCAIFVLALHMLNIFEKRQTKLRCYGSITAYVFSFIILLRSDAPYMAMHFFSFAVLSYCITTRRIILRNGVI